MPQWKWIDSYHPDTHTTKDALSVFEKVFREDAEKKKAAEEAKNGPPGDSVRSVLRHIFGIFN